MEPIGQLPNLRATMALADYLKLQNVEFDVRTVKEPEQNTESFIIFVAPQHYEFARGLYLEFVQNPHDERFLNASWQVGEVSKTQSSMGLSSLFSNIAPLTKWSSLAFVIIFVASYLGFYREIFTALHFDLSWSEPYRLFSPAIMHLSLLHLVFNLAWWWYLGNQVEKTLSAGTLITLFLISAAASNLLQAVIEGPNFAGLSGVNYALAGFAWGCGVFHKSKILNLPNNLFGFLMVWMVLGFADWLPINMANWAHLGGLVAGLGLSLILVKSKKGAV